MRFLALFCVSTFVLFATYLGLSRVIDPDGWYGTGRFPVLTEEARIQKPPLVDAYARAKPIGCLIVGSSHCMRLKPAIFERVTGLRTFNFGLSSARAEDLLAAYQYVKRLQGPPKALLVTLDPSTFDADRTTTETLMGARTLWSALDRPIPLRVRTIMALRHLKQSLTEFYAMEMGRSAVCAIHPASYPPLYAPDGLQLKQFPRWIPTSHWLTDDANGAMVMVWLDLFNNKVGPDPGRLTDFETLIAEAARDGARVSVWIPPIYPPAERYLETRSRYRQSLDTVRGVMRRLARKYRLVTADYTDTHHRPYSPDGWIDFHHFDDPNADRVAEVLAAELK